MLGVSSPSKGGNFLKIQKVLKTTGNWKWLLIESLKSDKSGEYVYGYIEEYANCTKSNVKLP
jgi:hypothetical protein